MKDDPESDADDDLEEEYGDPVGKYPVREPVTWNFETGWVGCGRPNDPARDRD